MYQVPFNPFPHFQRYAPDELLNCKIKKRSNSVSTGDRVMSLAFCNHPHDTLSVYQVSLNYLHCFYRSAQDKSVTDGRADGRTHEAATMCSPFGDRQKETIPQLLYVYICIPCPYPIIIQIRRTGMGNE